MAISSSNPLKAENSFSDSLALISRKERAQSAAVEILTPQAWKEYCDAIATLADDPRRAEITAVFAEVMPGIANALGVNTISVVLESLLQLSNAARSVLVLLLQRLPFIASRLTSEQALVSFLQLCVDVSKKAPSGLNPFIENIEYLLEHLSIGGLDHWARWGAQAYSGNYYGQLAYFRLESEPAKTMFQQERSGSLFVDHQRKLHYYTRALWNCQFQLRSISGEGKGRRAVRPALEGTTIKVPDSYDEYGEIDGAHLYMASTVHAAANLMYATQRILADDLTQAELHCIALFADAQIEATAIQRFPGLKRLWRVFFVQYQQTGDETIKPNSMLDLCMRMGHALVDSKYQDEHAEINQLAKQHHAVTHLSLDGDTTKSQGLAFYQWLNQTTLIISMRDLENMPLPYRTDHKHLWEFTPEEREFIDADHVYDSNESRTRDGASGSEKSSPLEGEGAEAANADSSEDPLPIPFELLGINQEASISSQQPGLEHYYDEWDYALQLMRPKWATVIERELPVGDPATIDGILSQHKGVATRLRHLIDAMQPQGLLRKRGYEDGEQIDIEAAIKAMIDIRRGIMPDPKINIRITHHERDFSILLLLDLSQSTNDRIDGTKRGQPGYREAKSILDLTREATGLLSWAIDSIGDNFAVHGFSSDGRSDVRYFRFKDFDDDYDHVAKARLAAMRGSFSTRMGAALRHAGAHLTETAETKKVVLLITDGAPSDIDEKDPETLRHDTKKAVEELRSKNVNTYCVTLDPKADRYVSDIFGANNYTIVDDVEALPSRLTNVFTALTK
ncbi:MAG: nitric oxide reductase NorD protein [Gammaproteobacteria bacterium]|jgi:nitric oxide reductase NorD protein